MTTRSYTAEWAAALERTARFGLQVVPAPPAGRGPYLKKCDGRGMAKVVSERPPSVRRSYVIPVILEQVRRIMREDQKSLQEMQFAGYLDLNSWACSD